MNTSWTPRVRDVSPQSNSYRADRSFRLTPKLVDMLSRKGVLLGEGRNRILNVAALRRSVADDQAVFNRLQMAVRGRRSFGQTREEVGEELVRAVVGRVVSDESAFVEKYPNCRDEVVAALNCLVGQSVDSRDLLSARGENAVNLFNDIFSDLRERYSDMRYKLVDAASISLGRRCLQTANFTYFDLTQADLSGSWLTQAAFVLSNLDFADLGGSHMLNGEFYKTSMRKARLVGAQIWSSFYGVDMSYADLRHSKLSGVMSDSNLTGANLRGADLSNLEINNVNLTSVKADDFTKLPPKIRKSVHQSPQI